jgi:uncharacterized membrane protein
VKKRPQIILSPTTTDKVVEALARIALIAFWIYAAIIFTRLPDTIPVHFNLAGEVDNYGSKWMVLILPVLATALFAGLTVLNWYPHIFNYPVQITDENARQQYTSATRLIRYLKLAVVIIFSMIVFEVWRVVSGKADGLNAWFFPVMLALIFIPLVRYIITAIKMK